MMKKLFTLFIIFFAFSITAFAQDKNISEKAKSESIELSQSLNLNSEKTAKVFDILLHKHKSLTQLNLDEEGKKELRSRIRKEIKSLLSQPEMVLLEKNVTVFNKVTKI
jgi:trehalose/maltose hydrolase-like predicted phosphorylase